MHIVSHHIKSVKNKLTNQQISKTATTTTTAAAAAAAATATTGHGDLVITCLTASLDILGLCFT